MNFVMRCSVAGSLVTLSLIAVLSGCSGNTELSGSSGEVGKPVNAASETQQDARQVLAAALSTAKENDRRVFVHVGAPW